MFISESIKTETRVITPGIAEALLAQNKHNRNISKTNLAHLIETLTRGEWQFNGEAIKIAADGTLLDGQHRLMACVESGISFETLIVYGLTRETQDSMDSGKSRTLANILSLHGYNDVNRTAAIVSAILRVEAKGLQFAFARGNESGIVTRKQALDRLSSEPSIGELAALTFPVAKLAGTAVVPGALYYVFSGIDAEDADDFYDKLATGSGIEIGNPILTLRNFLISLKGERGSQDRKHLAALFIKAWNKYRKGESISRLGFRPGGANPEGFPVPQ